MRHFSKIGAAAAAFVTMAAGCGATPALPCSQHADCPSNAICLENVCAVTRPDDCRLVPCTVSIVAPAALSYANGPVTFRVETGGGNPDEIRLLKDGAPLATLAPPYEHTWDTTQVPEGTYEVTAEARQGPTVLSAPPRTVVVDRSRPAVVAQVPPPPGSLPLHTPVYVEFSEPVRLPAAGPRAAVEVTAGDGASLDTELTLSEDGTRLAIRLLSAPAVSSQISLVLKPGITDLAGNALVSPPQALWTVVECSSGTGCVDCSGGGCSVAIAGPGATEHANGAVTFQLSFAGAAPEKVELLKDGTVLANVAPPYRYTWNTASEPEGGHQIVARATQGATVYSSEPRTVVVDRTAPAVVQQSPAPGDANVGVRAPITLQFSEPVRITTASPADVVSVTGGGGIALSVNGALSPDGRALTLTYVSQPQAPADVTLSLRAGITDLAGNALAPAGPWSWHMPMWQSLGANVAQSSGMTGMDMTLDSSSRPTVAWGEADGFHVARWTGTGWEVIGSGIRGPGTPTAAVVVAVKRSGDPVIAWVEQSAPDPSCSECRVFVKQRTSTGWDYLGQNPVADVRADGPSLAIDAGDGVWLSSSEYVGRTPVRLAVVRKFDGTFYWAQQGGNLNRSDRDARPPRLAFDRDGTLWAAWAESAGFSGIDNFVVYSAFASKLLNGQWAAVGSALNNDNNAPIYDGPELVAMPGGFPAITWTERLASGSPRYHAYYRTAYQFGWSDAFVASTSQWYTAPRLGASGTGALYSTAVGAPWLVYGKAQGQADWKPVSDEQWRVDPTARVGIVGCNAIRTDASGEVLLLWAEVKDNMSTLYVKRLNR